MAKFSLYDENGYFVTEVLAESAEEATQLLGCDPDVEVFVQQFLYTWIWLMYCANEIIISTFAINNWARHGFDQLEYGKGATQTMVLSSKRTH